MIIYKLIADPTVDFAAEELARYLHMMMPEGGLIPIRFCPDAKDGFRLGLMQELGEDISDAEDPAIDDLVFLDTAEDGGIIAGDNPRAILLAVYEYLRQNGCRWLMPGLDGEYIPMQNIKPVRCRRKASNRYRGWCNEGSTSQQSLLDMIDFTPKLGMNVCMLQWRIPYAFYERHYNRLETSEQRIPEEITKAQMLQWNELCEYEIKKRGLQLHAIGHGFLADGIGLSSAGPWYMEDEEVPDEVRPHLALVNGERKLFGGIQTNTNLCLSDAAVRRQCTDYVVSYALKHPYIDVLHVWLGDNFNNYCECDNCRKKRPSDWYVLWLNEVDEALTAKNCSVRIGFCVYVDLNWAPLTESLHHPERFLLGFGPSTRTRTQTLVHGGTPVPPPPYRQNGITLPGTLDEFFALLREWEPAYQGEKFTFEYHFWSHQFFDFSGLDTPASLERDLKAYREEGFGGMLQFLCSRHFFPNGFRLWAHAAHLFDEQCHAKELKRDYFAHAYGQWANEALAFFEEVKTVFDIGYLAGEKGTGHRTFFSPDQAEKMKQAQELSKKGLALFDKMNTPLPRVQSVCRKLLYYYCLFLSDISEVLVAKASGEDAKAQELFDRFRIRFAGLEGEIEPYYDHQMVIKTYRRIANDGGVIIQ